MLSLTRRRFLTVFALFCCALFSLTGVGTIVMAGWAPSPSNIKKAPDRLAASTSARRTTGKAEAWCGTPPANWQPSAPLVLPPHELPVTVPISIMNFAFNPSDVTINVGDTVTWTNNDPVTHTTTSDSLVWV